ncbi:hypothetical protein AcW1_003419 [Taiwanofungus camphoratus]|nr:hypothetical protein AcV5_002122 [Antrodia cinnamomea]KAI0941551.1 hypothetical protein AcW1_003419 [Antrodia cinnamomea]KAI0943952.1 hypothetical protein AcV7_001896 [Antrodia cinnamomea]
MPFTNIGSRGYYFVSISISDIFSRMRSLGAIKFRKRSASDQSSKRHPQHSAIYILPSHHDTILKIQSPASTAQKLSVFKGGRLSVFSIPSTRLPVLPCERTSASQCAFAAADQLLPTSWYILALCIYCDPCPDPALFHSIVLNVGHLTMLESRRFSAIAPNAFFPGSATQWGPVGVFPSLPATAQCPECYERRWPSLLAS